MAKRFTDSSKWTKPFLRAMKAPYKLLWVYILDECDHAGIWQVDIDVAQLKIGEKLDLKTALSFFEGKVCEIDGGEKWFILDFIEFQYGELNPENRAHNSVISLLKKYSLIDEAYKIKPLIRSLQGRKDMDKDMELVKDMVKDKEIEISKNFTFDEFWESYDKKTGDKSKLDKKWNSLTDSDREKIMEHVPLYRLSQPDKKYRKDPATYLNNKSWLDEVIFSQAPDPVSQSMDFLQNALNENRNGNTDLSAIGN